MCMCLLRSLQNISLPVLALCTSSFSNRAARWRGSCSRDKTCYTQPEILVPSTPSYVHHPPWKRVLQCALSGKAEEEVFRLTTEGITSLRLFFRWKVERGKRYTHPTPLRLLKKSIIAFGGRVERSPLAKPGNTAAAPLRSAPGIAACLPRWARYGGRGQVMGEAKAGLGHLLLALARRSQAPAPVTASLRLCGGRPRWPGTSPGHPARPRPCPAPNLFLPPCPAPILPGPDPARPQICLSFTVPGPDPARPQTCRSPTPSLSHPALRCPWHCSPLPSATVLGQLLYFFRGPSCTFSLLPLCHKQFMISLKKAYFNIQPPTVSALFIALSLTPGWLWRKMVSFSAVVNDRTKRLCLKHLCICSQMPHKEKKNTNIKVLLLASINASRNQFLTSPFSVFLSAINSSLSLFQKLFSNWNICIDSLAERDSSLFQWWMRFRRVVSSSCSSLEFGRLPLPFTFHLARLA